MSIVVGYNPAVEILHISGAPNVGGTQTPENGLVEAQQRLRRMVLDSVPSPNSRRNYAKALDDLFALSAGRPLTRSLFPCGSPEHLAEGNPAGELADAGAGEGAAGRS